MVMSRSGARPLPSSFIVASLVVLAFSLACTPQGLHAEDWYAADVVRAVRKYGCVESVPPATISFLTHTHQRPASQVIADLRLALERHVELLLSGFPLEFLVLKDTDFGSGITSDQQPCGSDPGDPVGISATERYQLSKHLLSSPSLLPRARQLLKLSADEGHVSARFLLGDLDRDVSGISAVLLEATPATGSHTIQGARVEIHRSGEQYLLSFVPPTRSPIPLNRVSGLPISPSLGHDIFVCAARAVEDPDHSAAWRVRMTIRTAASSPDSRSAASLSRVGLAGLSMENTWADLLPFALGVSLGCAGRSLPGRYTSGAGGSLGQ